MEKTAYVIFALTAGVWLVAVVSGLSGVSR
jgi:hypothetical protein